MSVRIARAAALYSVLLLGPSTAFAQVGDPFCLGVSCPCANDDLDAGCGNSGLDGNFATGARLEWSAGTTNVFADDLVLSVTGVAPDRFGMILIGAQTVQNPLGDGWLCIALGSAGIGRSAALVAGVSGSFSQSGLISYVVSNGGDPIGAGTQRFFQGYYRDTGGPCGSGFNLTNGLPVTFTAGPIETELAGQALPSYPHFNFVNAFNELTAIQATIDPDLHIGVVGQSADAYVVVGRSRSEWDSDATLIDARGASTPVTFAGSDVAGNVFDLDLGTLATPTDTRLSAGYDVVIDFDGDGLLSDGDFIDGRGDEDGLTVFRDPVANGPYATIEALHDHGGSFQRQRVYYPANIAQLGQLPLIVVSHGNGHLYGWYDHIGEHMASWGYLVMTHQNNTMPGPNAASVTTLENTDLFLGNLASIEGGALVGHVDDSNIVWMGHSRGAEGVAIAYHKLFVGSYTPNNYGLEDIKLVSSIAPTDFTGANLANPHDVAYQLWVGAADSDVNGLPVTTSRQSYPLLTRGTGRKFGVTYHGVGHGAFHDGNQGLVAQGPCQVGRGNTHRLMKGYFLPTVRHIVGGEWADREFLWRPWQSIMPIDAPVAECIGVVYEFWNGPDPTAFVVDDFEANSELDTSSSGGAVIVAVDAAAEGRLQDANAQLTDDPGDPMNGMTRNGTLDDERGLVFEWTGPGSLEFEVVPEARNFTRFAYLSFRACQATRHPLTIAELGDLNFRVTLEDGHGEQSRIIIDAYGSGIVEPYQRSGGGSGDGVGWANEFETTRIRLRDFLAGGPGLDLTDIVSIQFEFGVAGTSSFGRLGLDDIELIQE